MTLSLTIHDVVDVLLVTDLRPDVGSHRRRYRSESAREGGVGVRKAAARRRHPTVHPDLRCDRGRRLLRRGAGTSARFAINSCRTFVDLVTWCSFLPSTTFDFLYY